MSTTVDNPAINRLYDSVDGEANKKMADNPKKAMDTYLAKLAKLNSGLDKDEKNRLIKIFRDVSQYYHKNDLLVNGYSKDDEIAFVQAQGNPEIANKYMEQAISFSGCKNVDWSKVFTEKNGWPNINIKGYEIADCPIP